MYQSVSPYRGMAEGSRVASGVSGIVGWRRRGLGMVFHGLFSSFGIPGDAAGFARNVRLARRSGWVLQMRMQSSAPLPVKVRAGRRLPVPGPPFVAAT